MAAGLRQVAALPDPVGEVLDGWRRPNGLEIQRVRVPLGVVAIIYENRPNVTSDAAGLCLKAGNAALLRGSGTALRTNLAVAARAAGGVRQGRAARGRARARRRPVARDRDRGHAAHRLRRLPDPARRAVADPQHPRERDRAGHHRRRRELPRLRRRRAPTSTMAFDIVVNAKTQRPSVCNAAESLVVHEAVADAFLPRVGDGADRRGCRAGRRRRRRAGGSRRWVRRPTRTSRRSSSRCG